MKWPRLSTLFICEMNEMLPQLSGSIKTVETVDWETGKYILATKSKPIYEHTSSTRNATINMNKTGSSPYQKKKQSKEEKNRKKTGIDLKGSEPKRARNQWRTRIRNRNRNRIGLEREWGMWIEVGHGREAGIAFAFHWPFKWQRWTHKYRYIHKHAHIHMQHTYTYNN